MGEKREFDLERAPQRLRDLYRKAVDAYEKQNIDYAIELLSQCLLLEPAFLEARHLLRSAEIFKFRRENAGVVRLWLTEVRNLPNYLQAIAMMKAGKYQQSLAAAERLLVTNPLHLKYLSLLVESAIGAGMPESAIHSLELVREQRPKDAAILNWLGSLYMRVGEIRLARSCFERLSEVKPNDPSVRKALKDAMALESMHKDGWVDAAREGGSYRNLIKDQKEAVLLEQESKAVKGEKDVADLIEEIAAKVAAEPENMNYHRHLARLYVQAEKFDKALEVLRRAAQKNPGDAELDRALSTTELDRYNHEIQRLKSEGQEDEAAQLTLEKDKFVYENLQDRVQRYSNDLRLRYEWGVVLFEKGQLNDAIQQFQLAQRSARYRPRALYYMALCFKEKKQYDLATEQLEKADSEMVGMDNVRKDVCYELGQMAELTGDMAKAGACYKRIYQVDIAYKDVARKIELMYRM